MPLIRIDLRKGEDAAYQQEIGRVVYERSLVSAYRRMTVFRSLVSTENFLFDSDYIGIRRTNDLVIIQITGNEGRNPDQKKALYKAIAGGLHAAVGLQREDVFVNLIAGQERELVFR